MQGDLSCDIVLFDILGENAAAGVTGVVSPVYSAEGVRCLVLRPTEQEVENGGGMVLSSDTRLVLYDFNVGANYSIAYPAASGAYWDIVSRNYNYSSGRLDLVVREKQGTLPQGGAPVQNDTPADPPEPIPGGR